MKVSVKAAQGDLISEPRTSESGEDRRFRPDIQGLRAVAILLVVLFHAGVPGVSGGYVGVDVFFVISGFVITALLLRETASSSGFSLLRFYGRRARRIIPAATLVIIATVIGAAVFLGTASGHSTGVDGLWASVFAINFHFSASSTNYLASLHPPSPLQNFWSLAVEEQFYLAFPTILFFVSKIAIKSFRARLTLFLGLTIVVSFAYSVVLTSTNPSSAFFSPFTRAWEFALGALIASNISWFQRLPSRTATAASYLGMVGVLGSAVIFTSSTAYPGFLVAVPVVGAAMIIGAGTAQPRWGVEWLLRQRPMQLLGLISYSLYLWHWPILTIATQRGGKAALSVQQNLLWIALSLGLAIVTYLIVENPIRHARFLISHASRSITLGLCLAVLSFAVSAVVVGETTSPIANVDSAIATTCPLAPAPTPVGPDDGKPSTSPGSATKVRMMVIGDSTACSLAPGLAAIAPYYGIRVTSEGVIGCGVVSGRMAPFIELGGDVTAYTKSCQSKALRAEKSGLQSFDPNIIVWSSIFERDSIVDETKTGRKTLVKGSAQWEQVITQRIKSRISLLTSRGAVVVLLLQPPAVNVGNPKKPTQSDEDFIRMNQILMQMAMENPSHVKVVNLAEKVCPTGPPCPFQVAGLVPRPDDYHYGPAGSRWVGKWLVPQIVAATKAGSSTP
jgi:peptidoglycan/LPS O-acetylase OafA/YrhL